VLGDDAPQETETLVSDFKIGSDSEQVILCGQHDTDTEQTSWASMVGDFEAQGVPDFKIFGHRWASNAMSQGGSRPPRPARLGPSPSCARHEARGRSVIFTSGAEGRLRDCRRH